VDSSPCLKAWADSLGGVSYPLLSDFYPHGDVARKFGVLRSEGIAERAIFVIDKQGVIRYVDVHDIGQQPDNDVLFEILTELEPAAAKAPIAQPEDAPAIEPQADVVMYCTPWCPDCRRARTYLRERGIAFTEVDIATDRVAARRVREWAKGFETTPTFNVRGTIVVDFDRARLDELFAAP
jgi:glutaredoxin